MQFSLNHTLFLTVSRDKMSNTTSCCIEIEMLSINIEMFIFVHINVALVESPCRCLEKLTGSWQSWPPWEPWNQRNQGGQLINRDHCRNENVKRKREKSFPCLATSGQCVLHALFPIAYSTLSSCFINKADAAADVVYTDTKAPENAVSIWNFQRSLPFWAENVLMRQSRSEVSDTAASVFFFPHIHLEQTFSAFEHRRGVC